MRTRAIVLVTLVLLALAVAPVLAHQPRAQAPHRRVPGAGLGATPKNGLPRHEVANLPRRLAPFRPFKRHNLGLFSPQNGIASSSNGFQFGTNAV